VNLPEVTVVMVSLAQAFGVALAATLGAVDSDAAAAAEAVTAALADGLAPPPLLQAAAIKAMSRTTVDLSALRMS
jgi:hypothetical protein